MNWLLSIATHLKSRDVKTPSANGKRMCSVLIIVSLLYKLSADSHVRNIAPNNISGLFSMLCLRPDVTKFSCTDLKVLQSFIPDASIKDVAKALIFFIANILPNGQLRPDWVNVIPLVHFLLGKVNPFDPPKMSSKEIKWIDRHISLAKVTSPTAIAISK